MIIDLQLNTLLSRSMILAAVTKERFSLSTWLKVSSKYLRRVFWARQSDWALEWVVDNSSNSFSSIVWSSAMVWTQQIEFSPREEKKRTTLLMSPARRPSPVGVNRPFIASGHEPQVLIKIAVRALRCESGCAIFLFIIFFLFKFLNLVREGVPYLCLFIKKRSEGK